MKYKFSVDLLGTDSAVARKVLAGEPVLIYPKGTHHRFDPWSGKVRSWTVDDAVVARAVDNYTHRTQRGIRQERLPVNEDHQGSRALGWFKDVLPLPEGIGATFRWNRKGREALENGEFSYFSVEIYDELVDRVSGEKVYNQIAGGALTNYPFFGEATSLMSRAEGAPTGGYHMDPLEQAKAENNWLRELFASLFRRDQGNDSPPATPAAPSPAAQLPEGFEEQFTQLQTQVQQFSADLQAAHQERDGYAAQVQTLQGQLSSVQDARAGEHFAREAQRYAHLPAQSDALAGHLRWLHEADADGAHRDFFNQLLQRTDETLAVYFREMGVQRGPENGAESQIESQVSAYQAAHPKASYRDALDAVLAEHPELERQYNNDEHARETFGGAI